LAPTEAAPVAKAVELGAIGRIVEEHGHAPAGLVAVLQEIQREHGYLPASALREVARLTGRTLVEVYGVATFYKAFSLRPRGKHVVSCCLGTACHVRGAPVVVDAMERQIGLRTGETSKDGEFTLETVNCLGACALGPVVVIDGQYVSKVGKDKVRHLVAETRAGRMGASARRERVPLPLSVTCPHCRASLMDAGNPLDGLPSIRLGMKGGNSTGSFLVSSLYGSASRGTDSSAARGTLLKLFCTHCGESLLDGWNCTSCRAPMVTLAVGNTASLRVCSRHGCGGHMLDVAS
jgi:NADH-quinone oxidoreductase subunit E